MLARENGGTSLADVTSAASTRPFDAPIGTVSLRSIVTIARSIRARASPSVMVSRIGRIFTDIRDQGLGIRD